MSGLLQATRSRVPKGLRRIKLRTEQPSAIPGTPGWQGDYIFLTVAPNVCGVLRMGLAHATFLAPGIVWWFLAFWKKNCAFLPQFIVGRDSSVEMATGYRLDGLRIESRWGGEIFRTCPDQP